MELLERRQHLDELKHLLASAREHHGRLVFIGGEAGVGKTSLIRQFLADHADVVDTLTGACDPVSAPSALGPFYDIARATGGAFASLLDAGAPRTQLTNALMQRLTQGSHPVVLVIEDAHWADEATLDLIRSLARRIEQTPALALVTYRDDETPTTHPLRKAIGDLATTSGVSRIRLTPLSFTATATLASGSSFDAGHLFTLTGGNPFFVQEILASQGAMPVTVFDAILARAARLPADSRTVLDLAAVLGPEVDTDLLTRAANREVSGDIEQFSAAGLVGYDDARTSFRHELTRQAILEAIPPMRASAIHRQALNALMLAAPNPDPLRVAYHAFHAKDRDAVLAFAPRAAERLAALGRHKAAAEQYRNALIFAAEENPETRRHLLFGLATELFDSGRYDIAAGVIEELLSVVRLMNDRESEADHLQWLGTALERSGEFARGCTVVEEAIAMQDALPPCKVSGRLMAARSRLAFNTGNWDDGLLLGQQAIDLAQQFDDLQTVARSQNTNGCYLIKLGREDEGEALMLESLRLAQSIGSDHQIVHAYSNLGAALVSRFKPERAAAYLAQGKAFASDRELIAWHDYCVAHLAWVRVYQCRWADALAEIALLPEEPSGCVDTTINGLIALGAVHARTGEGEVWQHLDRALKMATERSLVPSTAYPHAARAEARWLAGDLDGAAAEAQLGLEALEGHSDMVAFQLAHWCRLANGEWPMPFHESNPFSLLASGNWQAAAAAWEGFGMPYEAAMARLESDSQETVIVALQAFEAIGSKPMVQITKARLREMGATAIPRGPRQSTRVNPVGLTSREMEVLLLVADGQTNPEIAAALFLSPKTIEHHVSSILGKVGASSRKDAAAIARDRQFLSPI